MAVARTETGLVGFKSERADIAVVLNFAAPYWPLAHGISAVYAALLDGLKSFGLTSTALRSDAGDGTLGAFNVNFWLFKYAISVRIRLDSIEFNAPNGVPDYDECERALLAVASALRSVDSSLAFASYAVTVASHGRIAGVDSKDFVSRFTSNIPKVAGSYVGAGTVFYFEGASPLSLLALTVDLSAQVADGVMVKEHAVYDGERLKIEDLRRTAEQQVQEAWTALGLVPEE